MKESLWNDYHAPLEDNSVLDEGIYDFYVGRIIELDANSILLEFNVCGCGIAQRIFFDRGECYQARYLLASVGILKNINGGFITSELANTVGRSGRGIVAQYEYEGLIKNKIDTYIAPWMDEKDQWWRYQVLKNARKICAACGKPGYDAHHIKPKSVFPKERYDISNGQCLCRLCHKKWHDTYGIMATGGPGL